MSELYDDHDDCVIDEYQISDYNSTSTFDIRKSSKSKVNCVVGIACEAEGKIVKGKSFYSL